MWTSQDAALVHGGGAMWTEAKRGWWRHGDAARDWAARRPPRSSPGLASALWLAGGRRLGRSCFRREPCPPLRCLYLARACCVWAGGPLALQPVRAGCLCSVVWFSCSRDASSHVCPWDDLGRFPGSPGATALPSAGALLLSQPASSPAVSLRGRGHASRPFTVCGSVACGAPPRPQGRSGFAASGASRWRRPAPGTAPPVPSPAAVRPCFLCRAGARAWLLPAGACVQAHRTCRVALLRRLCQWPLARRPPERHLSPLSGRRG